MLVAAEEVEEDDEATYDYYISEDGFAFCAHCRSRVSGRSTTTSRPRHVESPRPLPVSIFKQILTAPTCMLR